jgi:hypothetical protein
LHIFNKKGSTILIVESGMGRMIKEKSNDEKIQGRPIISSKSYAKALSMGYLRKFHASVNKEPFSRTINEMTLIVERMALVLESRHSGDIPGKNFSERLLVKLCESFVDGQVKGRADIAGSWSVLPEGVEAPSDARVDFVYKPTYLAISILTEVMVAYPDIVEGIPNYRESLRDGYRFATLRKLSGHGFDAIGDMIETIIMFRKYGILSFLSENPDFSPEMHNLLREIRMELESRLQTGNVKGGWNVDFSNGYREIVEALKEF